MNALTIPPTALFEMMRRVANGRKCSRRIFQRKQALRRTRSNEVHVARIGLEEIHSNLPLR